MTTQIEFPLDVARLRTILATQNVYLSDDQIVDAWAGYSTSVDKYWAYLPTSDSEIIEMLTPFTQGYAS